MTLEDIGEAFGDTVEVKFRDVVGGLGADSPKDQAFTDEKFVVEQRV